MISDPTHEFHFKISKNDRVLQMHREAMDSKPLSPSHLLPLMIPSPYSQLAHCLACTRNILAPRFPAAGLQTIRLPPTAGPADPHIPILATANIRTAKRIILYLGESCQDLGIFAYRTIGQVNFSAGSVIDFAAAIRMQGDDVALVVANAGQLLWNRRYGKVMTLKSWDALPRKGGTGMPTKIGEGNRVEGHEDVREHVASVLGWVEGEMIEGAKIEVVGICEGWEMGMEFLSEVGNWEKWKGKLGGVVFGLGYSRGVDDEIDGDGLREYVAKVSHGYTFLRLSLDEEVLMPSQRGRVYVIHESPLGTPLQGRNIFSSGESGYTECIMPQAHPAMLDFLQRVADVPEYEEPLVLGDELEVKGEGELEGWSWNDDENRGDEAPPFISPMLAAAFAREANGES